MARNPVQFQKGISLNEFLSLYGTEEQCFDALYRWRWPNGFVCPNCGHDRGCQLTTHKLQQCYRCNRQTSITAGTIFEATKLPLTVSEIPSCVLLSLYFNKLIFMHLTVLPFDCCAPNTAQWLAGRRSTPSLSD